MYVASTIFAARLKPVSTSPRSARTWPGRSSAATSASCMFAELNAALAGGISHSIGIRSRAVLAWYQVSATTATPPLNTRPRVSAGSGIGNCTAERTPGSVRIASKSKRLTSPPYTGHDLTAAHFMPGTRTSMP